MIISNFLHTLKLEELYFEWRKRETWLSVAQLDSLWAQLLHRVPGLRCLLTRLMDYACVVLLAPVLLGNPAPCPAYLRWAAPFWLLHLTPCCGRIAAPSWQLSTRWQLLVHLHLPRIARPSPITLWFGIPFLASVFCPPGFLMAFSAFAPKPANKKCSSSVPTFGLMLSREFFWSLRKQVIT